MGCGKIAVNCVAIMYTSKTKEMILGRIDPTSIPSLSIPVQRVATFKLLGVHLDASLSWTTHINTIVSKASKRLLSQTTKESRRPTTATTPLLYDSNLPSS